MSHLTKTNSLEIRWRSMLTRCRNPNYHGYHRYGGRGIKVCELWTNSYQEFCHWALDNGFRTYLTLDRIDNDGDYSPDNCRWTTRTEQQLNASPHIEKDIQDRQAFLLFMKKLLDS